MSKLFKTVCTLIVISLLSACTVVPPHVAYTGPRVEVVTVQRVPYYTVPPPYHHDYGPPHRYGHHRHWDRRWDRD